MDHQPIKRIQSIKGIQSTKGIQSIKGKVIKTSPLHDLLGLFVWNICL